MKIALTAEEIARLHAELDGNDPRDDDLILDAYEPEPPFTMEFVYEKNGIDTLAAAYLLYDAKLDGWYLGERIEDADELAKLIRAYLSA